MVVSAMPRRTTVVPKSERNPSAAGPHRDPGLGQVLQAGQRQEALARTFADHGREVGDGSDVGDLVERQEGGRPVVPVAGPGVGGVAHVADDRHDERSELALPPPGGAHVEGVGPGTEGLRCPVARLVWMRAQPSVRYAATTPDAVDQIPDCSRESVATIPASRSVAGLSSPLREARISRAGAALWRSIHLRTSRMERFSWAAAWSSVESNAPARSVQCWSPARGPLSRLAPTMASAVTTAASQSAAVVSGDQPTRSTPGGHSTSPLGS